MPRTGTPNVRAQAPTFVKSVANGSLYLANAQQYNQLPVVHLYGTPYDFGFLLRPPAAPLMAPQIRAGSAADEPDRRADPTVLYIH